MKEIALANMKRELEIRNYSPMTSKAYLLCLNEYFDFIGNENIRFFDENLVKDFLLKKKNQNCAPKTLNVHLCAVKFYYKEVLKLRCKIGIKFSKRDRKLPVVLSREQISAILKTVKNQKHKLALSIAYGSGLRVSEVANLRIHDIDFDQKIINIRHGKGGRDRITILPDAIIPDLMAFVSDRRLAYSKGKDWLFPSQKGGRLSTRTFQKIFRQITDKIGITHASSFHSLRHSFASHLLEEGVNLRFIQELLGHRNIRTTELYTHVSKQSLIKSVRSPL